MPDAINDAIEDLATQPQELTVGNQTVSEHSLPDLIEAARYLSEQRAAANAGRGAHQGLRFSQLIPPGAG